jgi:hypothetical protein
MNFMWFIITTKDSFVIFDLVTYWLGTQFMSKVFHFLQQEHIITMFMFKTRTHKHKSVNTFELIRILK